MSSLAVKFDDHAIDVSYTQTSLNFVLSDGREISAPLEWFPRLRDATDDARNDWRFIGNGIGVHWPKVDEDIAVRTLKVEAYYVALRLDTTESPNKTIPTSTTFSK